MARGKYIIFADSDDWVDPDELRDLYEKAERDNLEIVYCDYFENNGSEQKVIKQPECHTGLECIYSMLTAALDLKLLKVRTGTHEGVKARFSHNTRPVNTDNL